MKRTSLLTYQEFQDSMNESLGMSSKKLMKATEEYHEAQTYLQKLQNEFVKTPKEDTNKREKLKQAIIVQNKNVKIKESAFKKALGDEDIEDLEI